MVSISNLLYGQTFDEISNELCNKNSKGFIIFSENQKLSNLVSSQPELKRFTVYQTNYGSEIAKRFGIASPSMCAINKNMDVVEKEELSSAGWKRMKKHLKFKISDDCILIERPSEIQLMTVVQQLTNNELETTIISDSMDAVGVESDFVIQERIPEAILSKIIDESNDMDTDIKEQMIPQYVVNTNSSESYDISEQRYWTVQLGAYGSERRAYDKISKCSDVQLEMVVRTKNVILNGEYKELYTVCAGQFVELANAREWAKKLNGFVYEIQ
jgi:hypothetical protein